MFDTDNWTEIFNSIKQNKLRTFLTGFSISWGIFMFVIMMSSSNAAHQGLVTVFEKRSSNVIQLQGRFTSIPYEGFSDNRKINLEQKDFDLLNNNRFSEKEFISGMIPIEVSMSYADNNTYGRCTGIHTDYQKINGIKIANNQGRLFNELDIKEKKKVALINKRLSEVLYKHENPVGKPLLIGGLTFTVIGVYVENTIVDLEKAYIPFSAAQLLFNGGWGYKSIALGVKDLYTNKENEAFNNRLIETLAERHRFDPKDKVAINLLNQMKIYLQAIGIFNAIVIFIWVIGFGTLFAGMVGVSNIMLITVKERTREFGIRKALGAKPSSILKSIIAEAVCITTMFGYLGLFLGICVSHLFKLFLENNPGIKEFAIFENPTMDINIAFMAMFVLIVVGVLAGYFPAQQAVRIAPVEAMKEE